ncbi:ATP-binding protein [Indiicoccus explosivorum]|uniref:ATP-binding protein n=1 Tax=Indiicoccus explosivorum TaxID=1917864 RepID=UPI000B43644B|nr:ATP-binding protein [Indiicoccus explosivorum]
MTGTAKQIVTILLLASVLLIALLQLRELPPATGHVFEGMLIGMSGVVFAYALVRLLDTRQVHYLHFAVMGGVFVNAAFAPDVLLVTGGAGCLAAVLFAESFLSVRRRLPKAVWLFTAMKAAAAAQIIVPFVFLEVAEITVPATFAALSAGILAIAAIYNKKGDNYIKPFAAGWVLLLAGVLFHPMAMPLAILALAVSVASKAEADEEARDEWLAREAARQRDTVAALKLANERQDELLGLAAQNLKSPIHGIVSIAESLRQVTATVLPAGMDEQLGAIVANGKRLTEMVNEIGHFSELKLEGLDLRLQPVRLKTVTDDVLNAARPLLKNPQLRLLNRIPPGLPAVLADTDRLHHVLLLLINRLIRRSDGGEIAISAGAHGKMVTVVLKSSNDSRAPSDPDDSSAVQRLIELHGGEFAMNRKPGNGTSYRFSLPAAEDSASSAKNKLKKRRGKQMRILLAMKESEARADLQEEIHKHDFESAAVPTGAEVLRLLAERPADVAVIEQGLPDMTGIECCRSIRAQQSVLDLPVLIVAADATPDAIKEAFRAGANNCIGSGIDAEELLLRIRALGEVRRLARKQEEANFLLEQRVKERAMALEIAHMNMLTLNEEMAEVEKSRNEMLSAISHELGTPITLIHTYIQATKAGLISQADPRYLDMIHSKLVLLERLTEDLTDLTQYRTGRMSLRFEEIKAGDWLEGLAEELRTDVEQSGRCFSFNGLEGSAAGLLLVADKERLDQVFSNIIWNAIKHTEAEEGEIRLSAAVRTDSRTGAMLESTASDGELLISIEDNGDGIPKEALPHIFDRFFKGEKSDHYKGSGLGLAIAKEIIQSHHGDIKAESEPGHGSRFTIALPLKMEP